jgi:hypothetical protein
LLIAVETGAGANSRARAAEHVQTTGVFNVAENFAIGCIDLGWGINKGGKQMPPSHDVIHVYDPDALKMMTVAFDSAWQSLPANFKDSERARRKLALLVLRYVDRGEHNPTRLANMALLDFLK